MTGRIVTPGAYEVEDRLFGSTWKPSRFRSLRIVDAGVSLPDQRVIAVRVAARFGVAPPVVKRRGGAPTFQSWARPRDHLIVLGALAGPIAICHEVAHLVAPKGCDVPGCGTWHGAAWQEAFVLAVRGEVGDRHADRLAIAFANMRRQHFTNRSRAASRSARS